MTKLAVSQAIGQLAFVLASPLLTRMYSTGHFGLFQVSYGIAIVLSIILSMRIETIVPRLNSVDALKWQRRGYTIASLGTLFSLILIFLVSWLTGNAIDVFWHGVLIAFSIAISTLSTASLIHNREVTKLATRNILMGLLPTVLQLAAGLVAPYAFSLCASVFVGRLLGVVFTSAKISDRKETSEVDGSSEPTVRELSRGTIAGALGNLIPQLPLFLVGALSSPVILGVYALGQRVTTAPASLIGQGLLQNSTISASAVIRGGMPGLHSVVKRQFFTALAVSTPVSVLVAIVGPIVTPWLFGGEWRDAGVVMAILSPTIVFQIAVSPLTSIFALTQTQHLQLRVELTKLLIITLGFSCYWAVGESSLELLCVISAASITAGQLIMTGAVFMVCKDWDKDHLPTNT